MDDSRKKDNVSRREFLKFAAAGAAAAGLAGTAGADAGPPASAGKLARRELGKTGLKVSILGFGAGSRFLAGPDSESDAMLEKAIELGINYFDTAESYGKDRESEKRLGRVLPRHRKNIILATKSDKRSYDAMMKTVEESMKALKTDYIDLMQMHDAGPKDDIAAWEKPDGALTALRKLRDQKVIRFIGFTGHQKAEVHKNVIETLDFDTVLMALNAAAHKPFHELAVPAAAKKGMGIIGMKTTKGLVGEGPGKATAAELMQWVYDQPVSTAIIGMESIALLTENVKLASAYKPGTPAEASKLTARLSPHVTAEQLGWAMPEYRDA